MGALFGPNPTKTRATAGAWRADSIAARSIPVAGTRRATTRVAPTNNACVDAWELRSREATELYHRVLRDGIRFLSRDLRATTTRAGQALSRYFDFLPQLEKMDRARRYAAHADEDRQ